MTADGGQDRLGGVGRLGKKAFFGKGDDSLKKIVSINTLTEMLCFHNTGCKIFI